ncbi:N-acetyl-gamma-glutamyl-phosphate reductase [Striga asiatica]|uniref:N-acetyl-gamma-glutamyl-phosphate reductase n=1 Tax=Striga asiatica TaxID=4170 RepID=A0A5A7NZN4_STRAF|nr:N-acetyl-gamma-glutamyl-phosphate reductase [Striga asiatica]
MAARSTHSATFSAISLTIAVIFFAMSMMSSSADSDSGFTSANPAFTVRGRICCTSDGTCPTNPKDHDRAFGIGNNIPVKLRCAVYNPNQYYSDNQGVYENKTDTRGAFSFSVGPSEFPTYGPVDDVRCKIIGKQADISAQNCLGLAKKSGYIVSELNFRKCQKKSLTVKAGAQPLTDRLSSICSSFFSSPFFGATWNRFSNMQ